MQKEPTLLIALLGGRIQPAAMAALHLRPNAIACVASADQPGTITAMERVVDQRLPESAWCDSVLVSPYSPAATRLALTKLVSSHIESHTVLFSLTGAPMPMVVSAYEIARQHDFPAYYMNTRDGQLIDLAHENEPDTLTINLKVSDYLAVYGFDIHPSWVLPSTEKPPTSHTLVTTQLISNLTAANQLLTWLRASQLSGRARTKRWTCGQPAWELLETLERIGVVQEVERRVSRGAGSVHYRIASQQDRKLLGGGWLEFYVYQQAVAAMYEDALLFDSCEYGIHYLSQGAAERELDFMGMRRGKLLIASCRTAEKPWRKAALDELVAVASNLGGNFCTRLFVTNQHRPQRGADQESSYKRFSEQAKKAGVVIVTGETLGNLAETLKTEITTPTYARI